MKSQTTDKFEEGLTLDKYFGGEFQVIKLEDTKLESEYDYTPQSNIKNNFPNFKDKFEITECDEDIYDDNSFIKITQKRDNIQTKIKHLKKKDFMLNTYYKDSGIERTTRENFKKNAFTKKLTNKSQSPPHSNFNFKNRNYSKDNNNIKEKYFDIDNNDFKKKNGLLKNLQLNEKLEKFEQLEKIYNVISSQKKINNKILLAPIATNKNNIHKTSSEFYKFSIGTENKNKKNENLLRNIDNDVFYGTGYGNFKGYEDGGNRNKFNRKKEISIKKQ